MKSDDISLETLELVKAEIAKFYDDQADTNRTFNILQNNMKKAAIAEDFETAAILKKEVTSIQRVTATIVERIRLLRDKVKTIHESLCKQRFKGRPSSSGVKLTRVVIGFFNYTDRYHDIELFYINPEENISITLFGLSFDSEAYHLYDWAIENNLAFYSEQFNFTGEMIHAFEPST